MNPRQVSRALLKLLVCIADTPKLLKCFELISNELKHSVSCRLLRIHEIIIKAKRRVIIISYKIVW